MAPAHSSAAMPRKLAFPSGRYFNIIRTLNHKKQNLVLLLASTRQCNGETTRVIIKALRVQTEAQRESAYTELSILNRVTECPSPHVVGLIDSMEHDGWLYIAIPFVAGGDLFDHLHTYAPTGLATGYARRYISHVVKGLVHLAKTHGVAHGDVSLENIVLSPANDAYEPPTAQLIDMGSCSPLTPTHAHTPSPHHPCEVHPTSDAHLKQPAGVSAFAPAAAAGADEIPMTDTHVCTCGGRSGGSKYRYRGKMGYVPPEIVDGMADGSRTSSHTHTHTHASVDPSAVDVWMLGVTAFNMLTGRALYTHPSDTSYEVVASGHARVLLDHYHNNCGVPIDADARSFIASLLSADHSERPTLDQLLTHPWLTGASSSCFP